VVLGDIAGGLITWVSPRVEILLLLGGIGCWRWGWFVLQSSRAILYRYWVFPRVRREAERCVKSYGPVPEVTILALTDRGKPWITRAVFKSVFRELNSLQRLERPPELLFQRQPNEPERKPAMTVIYVSDSIAVGSAGCHGFSRRQAHRSSLTR
jgi:hypothetical protein